MTNNPDADPPTPQNPDPSSSSVTCSLLKTHDNHELVSSPATTTSPSCLNNLDILDDGVSSPEYGWCSLTPQCVQFMVNRKAFLIVFCVTCVLQGTFHTYFVAVITTLEKLFSIPSQVTGTLMMGSEIGQVNHRDNMSVFQNVTWVVVT